MQHAVGRRWQSGVDKNMDTVGGQQRERMSKQEVAPINFMNPSSGPRLGIFDPPDAYDKVMPTGPPNLTMVGTVCLMPILLYPHKVMLLEHRFGYVIPGLLFCLFCPPWCV